jgi:aspartate carbamoyltransferase regulatory subunit
MKVLGTVNQTLSKPKLCNNSNCTSAPSRAVILATDDYRVAFVTYFCNVCEKELEKGTEKETSNGR